MKFFHHLYVYVYTRVAGHILTRETVNFLTTAGRICTTVFGNVVLSRVLKHFLNILDTMHYVYTFIFTHRCSMFIIFPQIDICSYNNFYCRVKRRYFEFNSMDVLSKISLNSTVFMYTFNCCSSSLSYIYIIDSFVHTRVLNRYRFENIIIIIVFNINLTPQDYFRRIYYIINVLFARTHVLSTYTDLRIRLFNIINLVRGRTSAYYIIYHHRTYN